MGFALSDIQLTSTAFEAAGAIPGKGTGADWVCDGMCTLADRTLMLTVVWLVERRH